MKTVELTTLISSTLMPVSWDSLKGMATTEESPFTHVHTLHSCTLNPSHPSVSYPPSLKYSNSILPFYRKLCSHPLYFCISFFSFYFFLFSVGYQSTWEQDLKSHHTSHKNYSSIKLLTHLTGTIFWRTDIKWTGMIHILNMVYTCGLASGWVLVTSSVLDCQYCGPVWWTCESINGLYFPQPKHCFLAHTTCLLPDKWGGI